MKIGTLEISKEKIIIETENGKEITIIREENDNREEFDLSELTTLMFDVTKAIDILYPTSNKIQIEQTKIPNIIKNSLNESRIMNLITAQKNISVEQIRMFKEDIGKRNKNGMTALMYYCMLSNEFNPEIVDELKDELKLKDKNEQTALMYLCEFYDYERYENIIPFMEKLSDEIGITDKEHATALMILCCTNRKKNTIIRKEIIEFLKDEIIIKDENGQTPLMCLLDNSNVILTKDLVNKFSTTFCTIDNWDQNALMHYLTNEKIDLDKNIIDLLKSESNFFVKNDEDKVANPLIIYLCDRLSELDIEIVDILSEPFEIKDTIRKEIRECMPFKEGVEDKFFDILDKIVVEARSRL